MANTKRGLLARLVLPPQPEPPAPRPPRWVDSNGKGGDCQACEGNGRKARAGHRGDNEACGGCEGRGYLR